MRNWISLVALVLSMVAASGCTKTVTLNQARYTVGEPQIAESVHRPMVYAVQVRREGEKKYDFIADTKRVAMAGDTLGFDTDPDGVVYAMHNGERKPLQVEPGSEVVWTAKYKTASRWTKNLDLLGKASVEAAGHVMAFGLQVAVNSITDDSDCDAVRSGRGSKRDDRSYRSDSDRSPPTELKRHPESSKDDQNRRPSESTRGPRGK
jgi:uncharacterized cupredoxin-like copper-binding protein